MPTDFTHNCFHNRNPVLDINKYLYYTSAILSAVIHQMDN